MEEKPVTDPMQIEADVAKMRSMDRREKSTGARLIDLVQVLFQCLQVFLINLLVCWTFQWLSEGRD